MNVVVLVGNPKPASRTACIARLAADAICRAAGLPANHQVVDLSGLARRLLLDEPSPAVEDAVEQVTGADLLVVASPPTKAATPACSRSSWTGWTTGRCPR
jgi:FMN reductase